MTDEPLSFLARLKQHHLYGVVVAYAVVVGFLIQLVSRAFPYFGWAGAVPAVIIVLLLGFPVVVVLAWLLIKPKDPTKQDSWQRRHWKLSAAVTVIVIVLVVISGFYGVRFSEHRAERLMTADITTPALAESKSAISAAPAAATVIPAKSIAVLPFENLSGDPNEKYFSDGITVEILNALAQIPGLKVTARTSAFAVGGKNEDPRKIGETLGVANLLEGSVQKSGDEVRINVQLIDARTGYQRWSEKYDRKLTNIFTIEDDISGAIAGKLRVQLSGSDRVSVLSTTDDPQAHALYLQGIGKIAQRGPALKDAVAFLEQATARDPDYAAAWAALSQAHELLPWYDLGDWHSSLVKAESAAQRALALNPQLGEAHAALANVLRDRLDYGDAMREYQQALTLNPGSSEIHNQYAQLLISIGRFGDAIKQERIATTLDPLAPDPYFMLGFSLICTHRYDDAIAELEKAVNLAPDFTEARFALAFANLYAGHYADAEAAAHAAALQAGADAENVEVLIKAIAGPALRPAALKIIENVPQTGEVALGGLTQAFWYSLLGAHDKAIESSQHWAATAKPGEAYIDTFWLWTPAFDPIRNDPRFKAVLKKMGLPYTPPETSAP